MVEAYDKLDLWLPHTGEKTEPGSLLSACCAAGAGDRGAPRDRRAYDLPLCG